MSGVTKAQKESLAKYILSHDALPAIREDIDYQLFRRWVKGSEDERRVIGDIKAAGDLFFKELAAIVAEGETLGD